MRAALGFPRTPLVKYGNAYYRAHIVALDWQRRRVRLAFSPSDPRHEHIVLPVSSKRIWRGSYKEPNWEHVGMVRRCI